MTKKDEGTLEHLKAEKSGVHSHTVTSGGGIHSKFPIDAAFLGKPAHLRTRNDRYELGRALREHCPRAEHAEFKVARKGRPDPVQLIMASNQGRLEKLLPIRYGRMIVSPFAHFRGAATIMASDLSVQPATGYALQACGDCHLLNFGAFATPERRIVFDINDFDETFPAPWEWDLKRLAASFVIASRHNGFRAADCVAPAFELAQSYRNKMREYAEMPALEAWYSFLDYQQLIEMGEDERLKKRRRRMLEKAMARTHQDEFIRIAHVEDGKPRIKDEPPLVYHETDQKSADLYERVEHTMIEYRKSLSPERRVLIDRYEFVDAAMKVVGVGSVGTYCAIALFFAAENDPLFLQVKEARTSVLEPYVDHPPFASQGERVVFGQKLMQAASDMFLGHAVGKLGRHIYIRQLRDVKIKPMIEIFAPENMVGFAQACGWALARAHARSGDAAVIAGYIGKNAVFARAIAQFATRYADQNELDHAALIEAVRDLRLDVYSDI
ncbi:MAG TPA: DUF2252 domain-containing protein [Oculatellaceae cyanobacterium]